MVGCWMRWDSMLGGYPIAPAAGWDGEGRRALELDGGRGSFLTGGAVLYGTCHQATSAAGSHLAEPQLQLWRRTPYSKHAPYLFMYEPTITSLAPASRVQGSCRVDCHDYHINAVVHSRLQIFELQPERTTGFEVLDLKDLANVMGYKDILETDEPRCLAADIEDVDTDYLSRQQIQ